MEENREASTLPLPIPQASSRKANAGNLKDAELSGKGDRYVFPSTKSSTSSASLPQQFLFTPAERHNFPESLRSLRNDDDSLSQFVSETRQHRADAGTWNIGNVTGKMDVVSPTSSDVTERKISLV